MNSENNSYTSIKIIQKIIVDKLSYNKDNKPSNKINSPNQSNKSNKDCNSSPSDMDIKDACCIQ